MKSQEEKGCAFALLFPSMLCEIFGWYLVVNTDFIIFPLLLIFGGIAGFFLGIKGLFNAFDMKLKENINFSKAKENVEQSNKNLIQYITFLETYKPQYGLPIKTIGVPQLKRFEVKSEESHHSQNDSVNALVALNDSIPCVFIDEENESSWLIDVFPTNDDIILLYDMNKLIVLKGKFYKFRDILSYQVTDNSMQITSGGRAISTTTTDSGSLLGRGIVGGLVAGPAGAIIGASSASTTTQTTISDQKTTTKHHYNLYITVKDFENPVINYDFNENEEAIQECIAVLNIILENNQI